MIMEKIWIGKHELNFSELNYYMIKKKDCYGEMLYGVEILEKVASHIKSYIEYVSNNADETMQLIKVLCKNGVSGVHLSEVIDELIG